VLLAGITPAAAQQAIRWQPTLESAQRLAAQTDRLVLAHFWADWCHACKRMEQEVLSQPSVAAAVRANYVPVKINADYYPATCKQLGVSALPTDVILTPDGQVVERLRGAAAASDYVGRLAQAAAQAKASSGPTYAQVPGPSRALAGSGPPAPYVASAQAPVVQGTPGEPYAAYHGTTTPAERAPAPAGEAAPPYGPDPLLARAAPPSHASLPSRGGLIARDPAGRIAPPAGATVAASPRGMASAAGSRADAAASRQPGRPSAVGAPGSAAPGTEAAEPLCIEGYCPVELCENNAWVMGDPNYGIRHRGRTYLFAGPDQAQRFWADPDRYAPVHSGYDVVVFLEQGRMVSGTRRCGVFFNEQVYLFSEEATRERFEQDPRHYANLLRQAMRARTATPR
jgi:protein disulfide-isomerase